MNNEPTNNVIIKLVICKNLMCHSHLEITLGPLINFIISHNGSGKYAILMAIIICFGWKAIATTQGQSLERFIKKG